MHSSANLSECGSNIRFRPRKKKKKKEWKQKHREVTFRTCTIATGFLCLLDALRHNRSFEEEENDPGNFVTDNQKISNISKNSTGSAAVLDSNT